MASFFESFFSFVKVTYNISLVLCQERTACVLDIVVNVTVMSCVFVFLRATHVSIQVCRCAHDIVYHVGKTQAAFFRVVTSNISVMAVIFLSRL